MRVVLGVLLLAGLGVFGAEPDNPPLAVPVPAAVYFATAADHPGAVYRIDMSTGDVFVIYTRPRAQLTSFTFHPEIPEKLYYVDANDKKIFLTVWLRDHWSEEEVVYEHTTYVRDIAFGPEPGASSSPGHKWVLFFSEATGAGGGKIYYLDGRNRPVLFYEVHEEWAGDFAFDEEGNLYVSSGNTVPANLYKLTDRGLEVIFTHSGAIKGFVVRGGTVYFADWRSSICILDIATGSLGKIFDDPTEVKFLSDVAFHP